MKYKTWQNNKIHAKGDRATTVGTEGMLCNDLEDVPLNGLWALDAPHKGINRMNALRFRTAEVAGKRSEVLNLRLKLRVASFGTADNLPQNLIDVHPWVRRKQDPRGLANLQAHLPARLALGSLLSEVSDFL